MESICAEQNSRQALRAFKVGIPGKAQAVLPANSRNLKIEVEALLAGMSHQNTQDMPYRGKRTAVLSTTSVSASKEQAGITLNMTVTSCLAASRMQRPQPMLQRFQVLLLARVKTQALGQQQFLPACTSWATLCGWGSIAGHLWPLHCSISAAIVRSHSSTSDQEAATKHAFTGTNEGNNSLVSATWASQQRAAQANSLVFVLVLSAFCHCLDACCLHQGAATVCACLATVWVLLSWYVLQTWSCVPMKAQGRAQGLA